VAEIVNTGVAFWSSLRTFARDKRLTTTPDDEGALTVFCAMPRKVPTDWKAARLLSARLRCEEAWLI
jgi:hypothetical protein